MDAQWQMDRHRSVSSTSGRSFLSRTLRGRGDSDATSEDPPKGPYGLTTLHEPLDSVVADLVFVHGLGGGSRSTWTKSMDPALFWPQEWLPYDSKFEDIRIHTFGYNSNWDKESTLNIHDFAKSLLGSVQDCPVIPRGSNTPLILLGHSMGGLVIKKTLILARQMEEFNSIARRIQTIFFLATPHRGSDLAHLLSKILHVTSGTRPYVNDLNRNSLATQSINDEFPQHCKDIQLYSFYETLPMNYGVGKSLIVQKDMATLGYYNERTAYLEANHRDVVKFTSPRDPNYLTVRNALAAAIDRFRNNSVVVQRGVDTRQRRLLEEFLGVSDAPQDDLMHVEDARMPGSCLWLLGKESFVHWRDSAKAQIYWISAQPATGKSMLAGYVISHLKDLNRDCCYYFFSKGDKVKSTISSFLISMAWQLAFMHPEVLRTFLEIRELGDQLAKTDYRTIWRKLYIEGIFRTKLDRVQYWVIDALDECRNGSDLVPLLSKTTDACSIRILLTCRDSSDVYRQPSPKVAIISNMISADDTKSDILSYIEANVNNLPSGDDEDRHDMVLLILEKSAGCFLWVSLVLEELRCVNTRAETRQVLGEVPTGMDDLYLRILESMSRATYGNKLAKAILTWTACSARPLTTFELHHALQIDLQDDIDSVDRAIATSCGHLVYVDSQSQVQMVHQTARDFLLQPNIASEFAVQKKLGHKQLALACLKYLNGEEMKGPGYRKLSVSRSARGRSPFAKYACNSLFEHINHAPSTDDDVLYALVEFLASSNVLSWIEYIAENSDLVRLIQTGKAFKAYLQRRSKHLSLLGKDIAMLSSWSTDLNRLVIKFGRNLLSSPSSIHHLIPPFCPTDTAPRRQFAATPRSITLLGLSATSWDDCLSTIDYQRDTPSAVGCSDKHFAVGLASGKILIYMCSTCQEVRTLQQKAAVKNLQFGATEDILISASLKAIHVWDAVSWEKLWRFDLEHQCMSLQLTDSDQLLLTTTKNNELLFWDLEAGDLGDSNNWTKILLSEDVYGFSRPTGSAISIELNLLAVLYRGRDILIWDLERSALYDYYGKDGSRSRNVMTNATVWSVIFSPAPGVASLAAAYSDGDLVLFDVQEGIVKETTSANAQTLACTPDGQTLASGDSRGIIQLFDFETLKLLYRISSVEELSVRSLVFSADNHRLFDVRGSQVKIWDPIILSRQDTDDEASDTISISTAPHEVSFNDTTGATLISSLACTSNGRIFLCGKEDGSVYVYDANTGLQLQKLFTHAEGVSIISLFWDDGGSTISAVDASSRITTRPLLSQQNSWNTTEAVFDHRAGVAVSQILAREGHTNLLVSTVNEDTLWSIDSAKSRTIKVIPRQQGATYRWMCHPLEHDQLILIVDAVAHLYSWQSLEELTREEGILLEGIGLAELAVKSMVPCFGGTVIATAFSTSLSSQSKSKLLMWDTSDFVPSARKAVSIPKYQPLADNVECLVGTYGYRLVFLHNDGWICSADPETFTVDHHARHFFIPADWLSTSQAIMIDVSRTGDILFVRRDEVAVIKKGLDTYDQEYSTTLSTRSRLLSGKQPSSRSPRRRPRLLMDTNST